MALHKNTEMIVAWQEHIFIIYLYLYEENNENPLFFSKSHNDMLCVYFGEEKDGFKESKVVQSINCFFLYIQKYIPATLNRINQITLKPLPFKTFIHTINPNQPEILFIIHEFVFISPICV